MAPVVELKVKDLAQAAGYYEELLAVTPQDPANGAVSLNGDHLSLKLSTAGSARGTEVSLHLTKGMFARILDAAMKGKCQIRVNSTETVQLADMFGQNWTLQC